MAVQNGGKGKRKGAAKKAEAATKTSRRKTKLVLAFCWLQNAP